MTFQIANIETVPWSEVAELAEQILRKRKTVKKTTFQEMSKEAGLDNAVAYKAIRGNQHPISPRTRRKIIAWCKKHHAVLK